MRMVKFIRRWKRKRDWNAYGATGKRLRELEREYVQNPTYPLELEIDYWRHKRQVLHDKLTQEV